MTAETSQILNANDLRSGDVVYWTGTDWSRDIQAAALVTDEAEADAIGQREEAAQRIVAAYRIDVTAENGRIWPTVYREQVRAAGPSVRADLGKQAADLGKQAADLGQQAEGA